MRTRSATWTAALATTLAAMATTVGQAGAVEEPPDGLSCSYSAADRSVTVAVGMGVDDGGRIQRAGDEIVTELDMLTFKRVRNGHFQPRHRIEIERCAGAPTVHTTDAIRILMLAEEETDFDVSLEGGPLAPGATPEPDGTSEIEVSVEQLEPGLSVGFVGRPEGDSFRYGSRLGVPGVNLNAQDEAESPDIDATLTLDPSVDPRSNAGDWPALSARMGSGDDTVTTSGGPEFDGPFGGAVAINGGAGNDRLVSSSPRFTFIKGATGSDFIQGSGLRNVVFGGGGPDTIITGPYGGRC
jgi:Ca2+-binding RTX toxin-like protein